MAIIDGVTRIVWLEKEQLGRLGQALEQVLDQLPDRGPKITPALPGVEFELETRHQFRAGRMELGYDERQDRLIIIAHDLEAEEGSSPAFVCRLTPGQARELAEESIAVVAAGRPICPLCGYPREESGHSCEKQNGHFPHRLEEVREGDNDDE
jgi:uncharacterized repeat protein (TIGR03847 family)